MASRTHTIRTTLAGIATFALVALAGCERAAEDAAEPDDAAAASGGATGDVASGAAAATAAILADSTYTPDTVMQTLPEIRIYHTLTDTDWYARAEPLRHDSLAYAPAGAPVAAPLGDMEQVGEYGGVEYYRRRGIEEPVLYVPVFQGYWQPFRAEPDTQPRRGD
jgi:hypothetical protein